MIILRDLQWAEAVCGAPRAVSKTTQTGDILGSYWEPKGVFKAAHSHFRAKLVVYTYVLYLV